MDDKAETEIQFIQRMIAMLLSLAGLAENAARLPRPLRAFLLWVLRRAETAMQDYIGVEYIAPPPTRGNTPDDALDLADSFRELASFLMEDLRNDELYRGWWLNDAADTAGEDIIARIAHLIAAIIRLPSFTGFVQRPGFAPIPDTS